MKAELHFDLNDADDIAAHKRCIMATDMSVALWNISNLRKHFEWLEDIKQLTTDEVMDRIYQELKGIDLDNL